MDDKNRSWTLLDLTICISLKNIYSILILSLTPDWKLIMSINIEMEPRDAREGLKTDI